MFSVHAAPQTDLECSCSPTDGRSCSGSTGRTSSVHVRQPHRRTSRCSGKPTDGPRVFRTAPTDGFMRRSMLFMQPPDGLECSGSPTDDLECIRQTPQTDLECSGSPQTDLEWFRSQTDLECSGSPTDGPRVFRQPHRRTSSVQAAPQTERVFFRRSVFRQTPQTDLECSVQQPTDGPRVFRQRHRRTSSVQQRHRRTRFQPTDGPRVFRQRHRRTSSVQAAPQTDLECSGSPTDGPRVFSSSERHRRTSSVQAAPQTTSSVQGSPTDDLECSGRQTRPRVFRQQTDLECFMAPTDECSEDSSTQTDLECSQPPDATRVFRQRHRRTRVFSHRRSSAATDGVFSRCSCSRTDPQTTDCFCSPTDGMCSQAPQTDLECSCSPTDGPRVSMHPRSRRSDVLLLAPELLHNPPSFGTKSLLCEPPQGPQNNPLHHLTPRPSPRAPPSITRVSPGLSPIT
ncbi:hypothetical protein C7M84_017270 [Penaeus vannamei]|uniref:Uncharacterized protein n=1 Tax=Penaeus vannamei TaxID=6689 RepID=A0A3R7SKK2_PENVA|nr:hypothetical protein C7M84_017270 [Penaeus vannamei]